MRRRTKLTIAAAAAAAVIGGGAAVGVGVAGSGDEQPLTGQTRERAIAAALAHTGGGVVTETETGDDGAAYGVEIRRPDGTQVEVGLDADFNVIGSERDDDGAGDTDEGDDD